MFVEGSDLVLCIVLEGPTWSSFAGELEVLVIASNNGRKKRDLLLFVS